MKERLTGAIILVVLIVLLVPELLSGPKGPAATLPAAGAASPSSEEPPLRSYTINLADDSHTQSETANGAAGSSGPPQPQPTQPAQPTTQAATSEKDLTELSSWDTSADSQAGNPNSVSANPAPSSAATASPQPSAREQPPSHPTASPNSTTASSSQRATAASKQPTSAAAASRANQDTVAARTEQPKPSPPTATAPKANESTHTASAEKAAPKPHQAAPAASESGGLVVSGWGVQLGVFASKENADRLAVDVRTKGFKVSVSPVTSGKRKLYRVRVGPAADKSAAQDLQSKLKAAGRPGGTVVPYS